MSTSTPDPRTLNARGVESPLSGQELHHPIAIALHRGDEALALRPVLGSMIMPTSLHIPQREHLRLALLTRDPDEIDAALAAGGAIRLDPADVDRHSLTGISHGGATYLAISTHVPMEIRLAAWCALLDAHFACWPEQAEPPPPPRPPVPDDLQERFAVVVDHIAGRYLAESLRVFALASMEADQKQVVATRPTSLFPVPDWGPTF